MTPSGTPWQKQWGLRTKTSRARIRVPRKGLTVWILGGVDDWKFCNFGFIRSERTRIWWLLLSLLEGSNRGLGMMGGGLWWGFNCLTFKDRMHDSWFAMGELQGGWCMGSGCRLRSMKILKTMMGNCSGRWKMMRMDVMEVGVDWDWWIMLTLVEDQVKKIQEDEHLGCRRLTSWSLWHNPLTFRPQGTRRSPLRLRDCRWISIKIESQSFLGWIFHDRNFSEIFQTSEFPRFWLQKINGPHLGMSEVWNLAVLRPKTSKIVSF